jgi:hypothetical protein
MDRVLPPIRRRHLRDPDDDADLRRLTPAERVALVWPLTLQAWAFYRGIEDEPRLRRDVGGIARRRG